MLQYIILFVILSKGYNIKKYLYLIQYNLY